MILGAMQPYLFPYLGYFQLMECVDTYLFCGNLQYIRHGWINRNRILVNHDKWQADYFTFSVAKDDYQKKINQRRYSNLKKDKNSLKNYLFYNYRKAVNFEEAYYVIEKAMDYDNDNVSDFNINANLAIAKYMGIESRMICTDRIKDEVFLDYFNRLDYEERVIYLCRYFGASSYVNAIGGLSLYHKNTFADNHIKLSFLRTNEDIIYPQMGEGFIPGLSIIDVLMNNKICDIKVLLGKYQIV